MQNPMNLRVLVVDDVPINRTILLMHLKKLGIGADTANDGAEAVIACKTNSYGAVLMDLDMPVLDGLAATEQIRRHEQGLGVHTPIIALTSFDRPGDRERCLASGMDQFVEKGIGRDDLRDLLSPYLSGAAVVQAAPAPKPMDSALIHQNLDSDMVHIFEQHGSGAMEIITEFVFTARELLTLFKKVIDDHNALELTQIAYSLRGPCSQLRLTTMAKLCADIADDGFLGRWNEAEEKYNKLVEHFARVQTQADKLSY